jgi:hypothetical protein
MKTAKEEILTIGERLDVRKADNHIVQRRVYKAKDGKRHTEFRILYTEDDLKQDRKQFKDACIEQKEKIIKGKRDDNEWEEGYCAGLKDAIQILEDEFKKLNT